MPAADSRSPASGLEPTTSSRRTVCSRTRTPALTLVADASASVLRLTMKVAGLAESLVVTGRRVETRRSETPQKIEIVGAEDIERSVASDITDVLKKNAGVDVVQYNGVLSGVGIRGFRPETSGINKRSLLLIDGRPSGVTNLATLLVDNVDRIEIMKGPASSVYGASAMGGVINVITKHSRGKVLGSGRAAYGSFARIGAGRPGRRQSDAARGLRRHRQRLQPGRRLPHGRWGRAAGHDLQDLRRLDARRRRSVDTRGASTAGSTAISAATSTTRATSSPAPAHRGARTSSARPEMCACPASWDRISSPRPTSWRRNRVTHRTCEPPTRWISPSSPTCRSRAR